MGIRYYAYAFAADETARALASPRNFIGSDPLADAWGLEPGATISTMGMYERPPKRDMLYLDKAWRHLQLLTGPPDGTEPRAAFQMFEGRVTPTDWGWEPWTRAVPPDDIGEIARDLASICEADVETCLHSLPSTPGGIDEEIEYAWTCLSDATEFTAALARDGRGFAYMIG